VHSYLNIPSTLFVALCHICVGMTRLVNSISTKKVKPTIQEEVHEIHKILAKKKTKVKIKTV
jgi:hypothetical protein